MGLNVNYKTANFLTVKLLKHLTVRHKNWQILTFSRKKRVNREQNSGENNGMMLTVCGKVAKILTVSRKGHHPTETFY